ncbi:g6627 [Coccomyxa elongata]
MSLCKHGAYTWIEVYFRDCIYSHQDLAGFIFGMSSIACWLVAQMPQIISNIRNKSAEALSPWFLAEWLLGDTCNLLGCLLTGNQLATQVYTAMYFVCADVVLVVQYIYYTTLTRRRQRLKAMRKSLRQRHSRHVHHQQDGREAVTILAMGGPEASGVPEQREPLLAGSQHRVRLMACCAFLLLLQWQGSAWGSAGHSSESLKWQRGGVGHVVGSRHLLWEQGALGGFWKDGQLPQWARDFGQVLGYASSVFYLGSRVSQIVRNWRRHSAEGLSLAMFGCAIAANVTYGSGILLRTYTWADLRASTPWILGSLGTVSLDVVIFCQANHYRRLKNEAGGLLDPE